MIHGMLGLVETGGAWGLAPGVQERMYDWGGGGWHPMWGMWGVWGLGVMLLISAFWVAVLVAFVLGLRWLFAQAKATRSDPALDILRQRYARGEIGKEEFEVKKRDLTS